MGWVHADEEARMNQSITLTFPHSLPKQEARNRVETALSQMGQQLTQVKVVQFRQNWQGDRLTFLARLVGQEISGHVDVLEQTVTVEVALPAILWLVANAVRHRLQSEGRKLLALKAGS
jgi:predicted metal-dependent hydrolase